MVIFAQNVCNLPCTGLISYEVLMKSGKLLVGIPMSLSLCLGASTLQDIEGVFLWLADFYLLTVDRLQPCHFR